MALHYLIVACETEELEEASMELWEHGATGIEERDAHTLSAARGSELVAHFDDEATAQATYHALGAHRKMRYHLHTDETWKDGWKRYFRPMRVSPRIEVRPPWADTQGAAIQAPVVIDPGPAFGTGTHATTQLVLRAIDRYMPPQASVLDVGCGSGVLSIAALLLGARSALGVEIDEMALQAARENAERNGVAERFSASSKPLDTIGASYDLVCANIQATVLADMWPHLVRCVAQDGYLILSGLLVGQEKDFLQHEGWRLREQEQQDDWVALTLTGDA